MTSYGNLATISDQNNIFNVSNDVETRREIKSREKERREWPDRDFQGETRVTDSIELLTLTSEQRGVKATRFECTRLQINSATRGRD